MRNNPARAMQPDAPTRNAPRTLAILGMAIFAAVWSASCSPRAEGEQQTPSVAAANVKLTAEQLQHINFYTVAESKFRRTIETTGVVDFDNEQATSVLAPFSGPVSRLLVSPGQRVNKGDPLAEVMSADFATAIGAYRKAIATAQTARRVADLDKDLFQHQSIPQREAEQAETDAVNAETDREAALQALVSLNVDQQG